MTKPYEYTCPSGHTHNMNDFQAFVDVNAPADKPDERIVFNCPGGKREHHFTLAKAIESKMLTAEQADKVRKAALQILGTMKL